MIGNSFINLNELPSEAMNVNGEFLENSIPGYRTLSVAGRELATTTIESYQLGIRDGMRNIYSRIPERTLTIKYRLEASTNEEFRNRFNKLNVALFSETESQIWFNDEPEMIWYGSKTEADVPDEGVNAVVSTFTLLLNDPYKYTKSDATNVMWGSNTIIFQSNYLMGNTGSGAVNLPIVIEGGAYWGSTMITFQNQSYTFFDTGEEVKPVEIYPTIEGMKVKPIITFEGTGREVWLKTRNDIIDLGDFDHSTLVVDTKNFTVLQNGKFAIRPMNDFYLYANEPLYVQAKDSNFNITIRYPNRFL